MRAAAIDGRQPVVNLVRNNLGSGTGTGYQAATTSNQNSTNTIETSDGPQTGVNFLRRLYTATSTLGTNSDIAYIGHPAWGTGQTAVAPCIAGQRHFLAIYVRSNIAQAVRLNAQYINSAAGGYSSVFGPNVILTPNTWTRLTHVATCPASGAGTLVGVRLDIDTTTGVIQFNNGDTFDVAAPMVTAGPTRYAYNDPATSAAWKWLGTPNASLSAGYSPVLV